MSKEPTEKEFSTTLKKLTITNDLEKTTEISTLFKPNILCAVDRIKEKKKRPDIESVYDYLSRTEASNIQKISIELILNELVKENVVVNKKTSIRDSFRRINTLPNLVNPLHTDSCPNNELTITESVNRGESTADNNSPSIHADIQTPLTTNGNISSLTKDSDKAFMNMEATFSVLKGYINREISILNSKVDQFVESLKERITKIEKRESSSIEILQENIRFPQKELLAKNDLIKSLMETQTVALEAITNLKEKPQDQRELSNVTYKQQTQQHHQGHQNNQQKFLKNKKQQQNYHRYFQNQRHQQQPQKQREQQQDGKQQQQHQQKLQFQTRQKQHQQQKQEQLQQQQQQQQQQQELHPTSIDLILTNRPSYFQRNTVFETALSDFHLLTITEFKTSFQKREPEIIKYRDYKNFDNNKFRSEILKRNFNYTDLRTFKETVFNIFNKYAPIKRKYVRANEAPFMTKELQKAIMKRSRLRNKFLKDRTENNQKNFKHQRNFCKKLLRTTKKSHYSNLDIKKVTDNKTF